MKPTFALCLSGALFSLAFTSSAMGASQSGSTLYPLDLSSENALSDVGSVSFPLKPASAGAPLDIIRGYLAEQGVEEATLQSLEVEREHYALRNGRTHFWLRQRVQDIPVHGTYVKASFTEDGALVHIIWLLQAVPSAETLQASLSTKLITPTVALQNTLKGLYGLSGLTPALQEIDDDVWRFAPPSGFSDAMEVSKLWIPLSNGALGLGFRVQTWDHQNLLRHTLVDATGVLLSLQERTAFDAYLVYPENPDVEDAALVEGPGGGSTLSAGGWLYDSTTVGNNVDAYLDANNDNSPDGLGRPVSDHQEFTLSVDLKLDPAEAQNPLAAVQNLFYHANYIHDLLYAHGFTESAGNFQNDNFGLDGLDGDNLNAEAQDGGGTNNANFATPEDGQHPRMQMYLWTPSDPRRDGALDSDIIYHEYGHGLTWRIVGDMSGMLAGALGEGMSDALAIILNDQDTVAEYANNNVLGVRRAPYEGYPYTYKDVQGKSVHSDGEVFAAAMWRLHRLWQDNALERSLLLDLIVDGLNYTPSQPSFESMRDGLLVAVDEGETQQTCLIWEAFAKYGMGVGSKGVIRGAGQLRRVVTTESYTVPEECVH